MHESHELTTGSSFPPSFVSQVTDRFQDGGKQAMLPHTGEGTILLKEAGFLSLPLPFQPVLKAAHGAWKWS